MTRWALITALQICPGIHYGDEGLDVYYAACPGLTLEACNDGMVDNGRELFPIDECLDAGDHMIVIHEWW
jgi:hypothetical protein